MVRKVDPLQMLLQLPAKDGAAAATALIASLDGESDENAEAAWAREIRRRVWEIDAGGARLVPWGAVKAKLRRKYGV